MQSLLVGHGPDRRRHGAAGHRRRASCWSPPSGSTPSSPAEGLSSGEIDRDRSRTRQRRGRRAAPAARRDAQHPRLVRRRSRRRRRQRRPPPRRGRRARRRQRRRQVHPDPGPVRRAPGGRRRDLHQRREGLDLESRAMRRRYGIETIYQTLALADNVDAAANLFLGREITTRLGSLDDAAMESATREVMGRLNPNFRNFKVPVKSLSGGQRQSVAIARAVHFNARILIMDEPTAALGPGRDRPGPRAGQPAEVARASASSSSATTSTTSSTWPTGSASCSTASWSAPSTRTR